MISFGPRSILLAIGTIHGLVLAALLLRARSNRTANRLLALLLTIVALRILPYIIGFAGFYEVYPWLSYLPYEWSLASGAVLWLYVTVLCTGTLPRRWWWHLVPALVQGAYYTVMFVQPLVFKNHWNRTVHVPYVIPVETVWTFAAMAAYLALAWRAYGRYQRWLDADLSNREEFRLTWVRAFILALSATLVLWAGTELVDAMVTPLNYFDRFGLYLWFSLLVYGLGVGGLRSAGLRYPRPGALEASEASIAAVGSPTTMGSDTMVGPATKGTDVPTMGSDTMVGPATKGTDVATMVSDTMAGQDWERMGREWSERVRAAGWWRDADLTAPLLARHLATNTTYLSRALNTGLGHNFNEFVNLNRVEAVQAELAKPGRTRDILAIALDAGFSSKASFNRVFKRLTGETPTEFRRRQGLETSQLP